MISIKDLKLDNNYELGLTKFIGKQVKEVRGYFTDIGGGATFLLTKIEFEDGTFLGVEGEHDAPYLVEWRKEQPNFDEETLERLRKEQNNE